MYSRAMLAAVMPMWWPLLYWLLGIVGVVPQPLLGTAPPSPPPEASLAFPASGAPLPPEEPLDVPPEEPLVPLDEPLVLLDAPPLLDPLPLWPASPDEGPPPPPEPESEPLSCCGGGDALLPHPLLVTRTAVARARILEKL
jgi:hypothetical protein